MYDGQSEKKNEVYLYTTGKSPFYRCLFLARQLSPDSKLCGMSQIRKKIL
jgi:hypothetical protein